MFVRCTSVLITFDHIKYLGFFFIFPKQFHRQSTATRNHPSIFFWFWAKKKDPNELLRLGWNSSANMSMYPAPTTKTTTAKNRQSLLLLFSFIKFEFSFQFTLTYTMWSCDQSNLTKPMFKINWTKIPFKSATCLNCMIGSFNKFIHVRKRDYDDTQIYIHTYPRYIMIYI